MKKILISLLVILVGVAVYYFFPESRLPEGKSVDRLEVLKAEKKMIAYAGDVVLKTYVIALGKKVTDEFGDEVERLPLGNYIVIEKDARSRFYKNLAFVPADMVVMEDGVPRKKKSVAALWIHGMKRGYGFIGKFHRWFEWTKGGVGITDDEIDDLFGKIEVGAKVTIAD